MVCLPMFVVMPWNHCIPMAFDGIWNENWHRETGPQLTWDWYKLAILIDIGSLHILNGKKLRQIHLPPKKKELRNVLREHLFIICIYVIYTIWRGWQRVIQFHIRPYIRMDPTFRYDKERWQEGKKEKAKEVV